MGLVLRGSRFSQLRCVPQAWTCLLLPRGVGKKQFDFVLELLVVSGKRGTLWVSEKPEETQGTEFTVLIVPYWKFAISQ